MVYGLSILDLVDHIPYINYNFAGWLFEYF